jgi:hypothetical protein
MAGPSSSFVPPQVTPSKAKRRFRLEEANRALPLVSRIVRDIVATHQKVAQLQAQQPKQSKGSKPQPSQAANGNNAAQKELDASVDRLQSFVEELTNIGVELKDYQTGLVDFIGRHQGRDVYLCWKLGETNITHWHELQAGFSGRQPVATLEESD